MNHLAHTTINTTAIAVAAYTAKICSHASNQEIIIFAGTALLATLLLSPDLDLRRSSPTKNWGLLKILWLPYQAMFKHRGWSHNVLLSSLTRIGYLLLLTALLLIALNFVPSYLSGTGGREALVHSGNNLGAAFTYAVSKVTAYKSNLCAGAIGIFFSDMMHILVDKLF